MNPRQRLAAVCQDEARAYGYTLTIWGAGALLIHAYGKPHPLEVFGYIFGAIIGYALLIGYTFQQPFAAGMPGDDDESDASTGREFVAASTVHFIATPGNLLIAYGLILLSEGWSVPVWLIAFVVGAEATTGYNVLTVMEDYIGRRLLAPRLQHGD